MNGGAERSLRDVGLSPGAEWKWTEVLSLAGDGTAPPPGYWKRFNWHDAMALEPLGWGRFPRMADFALSLTERALHPQIRTAAIELCGDFPTVPVVERLAAIMLDREDELEVRNAAAMSLGTRRLGVHDDAFRWTDGAVVAADAALTLAFERGMQTDLKSLDRALMNVASPALDRALLAAPLAAAAGAVDAFATPELAKRLLDGLPGIPAAPASRICGLVARVLGADAAPALLAYAERAPLAARTEAFLAALAVAPDTARGAVEAWLASMPMMRTWAARAEWHTQNPGILPVASALPIARSLGVMAPDTRVKAAAEAASLFRARASLEPLSEDSVHDLWLACAWCARSAAPAELVLASEAAPRAFERALHIAAPVIDALIAQGRPNDAERVALERSQRHHAVWAFAAHGDSARALRIAEQLHATNVDTIESVAGEALAHALLGHDERAVKCLEGARLTARPVSRGAPDFPGPDELHRVKTEPERYPLLTAIVRRDPSLLRSITKEKR